jgi:hypothetical protein
VVELYCEVTIGYNPPRTPAHCRNVSSGSNQTYQGQVKGCWLKKSRRHERIPLWRQKGVRLA